MHEISFGINFFLEIYEHHQVLIIQIVPNQVFIID